jgi:glycine oxidase
MQHFHSIIVGQGIAGTTLAWRLLFGGDSFCVLNRVENSTSSLIAAGLISPITGQRLVKSWRWDEVWPEAQLFYERVSKELGETLLFKKAMVRIFSDQEEVDRFAKRQIPEYLQWMRLPDPPLNPAWFQNTLGSFEMPDAAQLNSRQYILRSRERFESLKAYHEVEHNLHEMLKVEKDGITIPSLGIKADRLFFCEGAEARFNPWFPKLRFNAAKGEVLTLRIPELLEDRMINRGIWLTPHEPTLFRCGSTYEWDQLDSTPTDAGKKQICEKLRGFMNLPFEIVDHQAAVRPVIDAGKPLIGYHPALHCLGFLNGLGSKGSLLAPFFSNQLLENRIDSEIDVARFLK